MYNWTIDQSIIISEKDNPIELYELCRQYNIGNSKLKVHNKTVSVEKRGTYPVLSNKYKKYCNRNGDFNFKTIAPESFELPINLIKELDTVNNDSPQLESLFEVLFKIAVEQQRSSLHEKFTEVRSNLNLKQHILCFTQPGKLTIDYIEELQSECIALNNQMSEIEAVMDHFKHIVL